MEKMKTKTDRTVKCTGLFFLNVKLRGPESQIMDEKVMSGHFEGQSEYF